MESLERTIGVLTSAIGIQRLRNSYANFPKYKITLKQILDAFRKLGVEVNGLDANYYTTNIESWEKIINDTWGIVKNFKWEADVSDCDNRAGFVQHLVSFTARLNTCGDAFVKITNTITGATDMHHPNLIIDNNGSLYIYDVDNNGLWQKITSNGFIMGTWKYDIQSVRLG